MGALDAITERHLTDFAAQVQSRLGPRLVCLAVYGSAAGGEWVPDRSDVNVVVVVDDVSLDVLDALAPVVAARPHVLALPLVLDPEYLARARDTFPMELTDLARRHRVLAGEDVLRGVTVDAGALRRQCEQEARGKLLRLRALYLQTAGDHVALERVMLGALKSFLLLLRHLLELRGAPPVDVYEAVLTAGEAAIGPLPVMRSLYAHRTGTAPLTPATLRTEFRGYLDEVGRIVAALDELDA